MATVSRHPRLILTLSFMLAAIAAIAVYALVAAAATRPMTGQIQLFGGPNGEWCTDEAFVIALEGEGTLAHLGKVDITARNCNVGDLNFEPATIGDGEATFTTADGATLTVSYEGSQTAAIDGISHFAVSQTITGGTGRLAGATGSWQLEGTVNINSGELHGDLDGWIRY